jgi:hypothetical protein
VVSSNKTLVEWSHTWIRDASSEHRVRGEQWHCAKDLKRIVETTAKIAKTKGPLFSHAAMGNRKWCRSTDLGKDFLVCLKADTKQISKLFPRHRYSPFYIIFKRYTSGLQDWERSLNSESLSRLNDAVSKIRALANGTAVAKRLDGLRRSERENARSVSTFLDGLREKYAKLLVIRIDLEYLSAYGPGGYQGSEVTLDEAKKHREEFLAYLRKGPFKRHLAGYVWKWEWGFEKGSHHHLAIFFDGQRVREDITVAQALGRYWRDKITAGKGMVYVCNMKKESYAECFLGLLHRGDEKTWAVLRDKMRYLTKVDLYMRFVAPGKGRRFGVGGVYLPNSRGLKPLRRHWRAVMPAVPSRGELQQDGP